MVLKDGGPCIALKKDKATGNMNMCGKMRDHLFYAGPICKGCYESASRKKQKESGVATGIAVDLEDLQEESQEKLVEIEEIRLTVRQGSNARPTARTRDPQPNPTQPSVLTLLAHTLARSDFCVCSPCCVWPQTVQDPPRSARASRRA